MMKFFKENIARLRIPWNERPLTEDDFYRLCRREKIRVTEYPLDGSDGFYYFAYQRHHIVVDPRLPPAKKLFVMFHELAHYLMHEPGQGVTANFYGVGTQTRMEFEADAFAHCALIPKTWIETRPLQELIDEEGIDEEMLAERLKLFEVRKL